MHILYFTQYYYPEITAGAFRAQNIIKYLEKDNKITVFTTYPNHPSGEIAKGYSNKLLSKEYINNTLIFRSKIICYKNSNFFKRLMNYFSFSFFALINLIINKKQIGNKFDYIYASSGPIFAALTAFLFSKVYNIPLVVEFRDITWLQVSALGKTKISRLIRALELFIANRSKKIIVTTDGFKEVLIKEGIKEEKINVVSNVVNVSIKKEYNQPSVEDNELRFLYLGTIGVSQNIFEVVDFFNGIKFKKKRLTIIGDGADKSKLINYVKEKRISSIEFMKPIDKKDVYKYYYESDFIFVKLKNVDEFKYFIPSKFYDILSHSKAVLYYGPKGEVSNIIDTYKCGVNLCGHLQDNISYFNTYLQKYDSIVELKEDLNELGNRGFDLIKDKLKEINEEFTSV